MPTRPAALQPIPRRSLSREVFDQLVDHILRGTFPAREPLPPERVLCARLGVSRTAVREALARLEQLGLVSTRHGGETTARDWQADAGLDLLPRLAIDGAGRLRPEVMRSVVEMRAALAPDVARLAAQRGGPETDVALDAVLAAMGDARANLALLQDLSFRFWTALTAASGNVAYRLSLNSLREAYLLIRTRVAGAMEAELRDLDGYREIAQAVKDRDPAGAEAAARRHIERGLRPVLHLFGPDR